MPHTLTGYGNIASDFKIFAGKTNKVANFSIAVTDMGKTIFFNCVTFSSAFTEKSWELLIGLKKGNPMYFVGRLSDSEYTDKKTNEQKKSRQLIISNFELVGGKRSDEGGEKTPSSTPTKAENPTENDDIPF